MMRPACKTKSCMGISARHAWSLSNSRPYSQPDCHSYRKGFPANIERQHIGLVAGPRRGRENRRSPMRASKGVALALLALLLVFGSAPARAQQASSSDQSDSSASTKKKSKAKGKTDDSS